MKILSIDVGIKNLAYCLFEFQDNQYTILEWNVMNLCGEESKCTHQSIFNKQCTNKAHFFKKDQFFCNKCAKKTKFFLSRTLLLNAQKKNISKKSLFDIANTATISLSKNASKSEILALIHEKCLSPIQNKTANNMNLIEIGIALKNNMNAIPSLCSADKILIENQISPIANRMKTLQGMIAQYFIMQNITDIEFVSASNKLKSFTNNQKTTYSERKKLGIDVTKNILTEQNFNEKNDYFNQHKKKDDLADSFLQGLWYIQNII